MKYLSPTIAIAILLFCSAADSHAAATRRFVEDHPDARFADDGAGHRRYIVHGFHIDLAGDVVESAREALLANGDLLGLEGFELVFDRVVGHQGSRYVKFALQRDGLPVFGVRIIGRVDPHGAIVRMSSKAPRLPAVVAHRIIDAEEAARTAEDFDGQGRAVAVHEGFVPIHDQAVRVFRVLVAAPGPHRWVTFVDAHSGNVIYRYDEILHHAANVYLENPVATPDLTEVLLEGIIPDGPNSLNTYGQHLRVARCTNLSYQTGQCLSWIHQAEADAESGFLHVLPDDNPGTLLDGFAEVQTYHSLDTYYAFWREEFGFDPAFIDADSMTPGPSIWTFVNANFANAYFSGSSSYYGNPDMIVLGQGNKDFSYDNDISRHEFTHAVSSQIFNIWMYNVDDLGTDMSGGGVEEGTADYFPCSFHGNPELGEYMGVIRSAHNARKCPEHLVGQSHEDGMIISGTMWAIRQNIGRRKADHLHYGALASNTIVTFNDYAAALEIEAFDMMIHQDPELRLAEEDFQVVQDTLDFRNLRDCRRVVPVNPGDQKLQYMPYAFSSMGTPSPVQYVVSSRDDTEQLSLTVMPYADPYDIYVRAGQPVRFSWTQSGWSLSWEAEYDMAFLHEGEKIGMATVSNVTDLVLEKNTDYYFSLVCRNTGAGYGCQNLIGAHLSTTPAEGEDPDPDPDPEPEPDEDDDAADAGSGSDGCDCRVGAGAPRPAGLISAVLSLFDC